LGRYNADIIRFAILTNHYSSEINITRDLFIIASKRVYYFYSLLKEIDDIIGNNKIAEGNNLLKDMIDKMNDSFRTNLDNNLNIANFIADLFQTP
jgi:cysteinyl-tRNA synthetase